MGRYGILKAGIAVPISKAFFIIHSNILRAIIQKKNGISSFLM